MNKQNEVKVTIEIGGEVMAVLEGANIIANVAVKADGKQAHSMMVGEFNPLGMAVQVKNIIEGVVSSLVENGMSKGMVFELMGEMMVEGVQDGFESVEKEKKDPMKELLHLLRMAGK
jgi:hypothetical protein